MPTYTAIAGAVPTKKTPLAGNEIPAVASGAIANTGQWLFYVTSGGVYGNCGNLSAVPTGAVVLRRVVLR